MNLSKILLIFTVLMLLSAPIGAERVFFSDGTVYNGSVSKDEILQRFDNTPVSGPIVVFHDYMCASCTDALAYLHDFVSRNPDVQIEYYDLYKNVTNRLMFEDYMTQYHQKNLYVPTAFIGPVGIEGNESIKTAFEPFALLYQKSLN